MTEGNSEGGEFVPAFDGQRPDEELILVFRRHPLAMRKGYMIFFIIFALSAIPPLIWQTNLSIFWLPVIGFVLGLIIFGYHLLMWYYTVFIVTNQRIRQITQKGLFGTSVFELNLTNIQNMSYNIPGLVGELLGYGTIVIQTIAGDLVIHKAPHPDKIYNKLQDAAKAAEVDRSITEQSNDGIQEEE